MATIFTSLFIFFLALFLQTPYHHESFSFPKPSNLYLHVMDLSWLQGSNTLSEMLVEGTYLKILLSNEHAELRISGPKLSHDRCHT